MPRCVPAPRRALLVAGPTLPSARQSSTCRANMCRPGTASMAGPSGTTMALRRKLSTHAVTWSWYSLDPRCARAALPHTCPLATTQHVRCASRAALSCDSSGSRLLGSRGLARHTRCLTQSIPAPRLPLRLKYTGPSRNHNHKRLVPRSVECLTARTHTGAKSSARRPRHKSVEHDTLWEIQRFVAAGPVMRAHHRLFKRGPLLLRHLYQTSRQQHAFAHL